MASIRMRNDLLEIASGCNRQGDIDLRISKHNAAASGCLLAEYAVVDLRDQLLRSTPGDALSALTSSWKWSDNHW